MTLRGTSEIGTAGHGEKRATTTRGAEATRPRLVVSKVRIQYRHPQTGRPFCAVRAIDFTVGEGEVVAIVGPSGCGKSTVLGAVAGLVSVAGGEIAVAGSEPGRRRATRTAVVFQKPSLLPWRTALRNVEYPLRLSSVPKREAHDRAVAALDRVGLTGFHDYYPDQLSGGMQQRVNLARALAVEPQLLLLDEPFASVDAQTRELLQDQLLQLFDSSDLSAVFVTHQIEEAALVGDRIVVMSHGPGSVVRDVVDVPLPRPRPANVRRSPAFQVFVDGIWTMIREELVAEAMQPDVRDDGRNG